MKDPVQFNTTSDYVYHQLRNQIITKKLRAGQRLPEITLAKQLEVSRTPVREALRRLANEGMVQLIPNGGARLLAPTKEEIVGTYEVRDYLERLAVKKAASRITPLQICRLEEQIELEEKSFQERDLESYLEVNNSFHRIIAEASGNIILADYIDNVLSRTYVFLVFYETFFDFQTNPSLDEHRAILKALSDHDEDLSVKLMEDHLSLSLKGLAP
ncbi:GntR family transcriptional regulator [Dethiosulfovibrio salsuginis]|uniref:DNA-binding transcriptional regulator, GntR family n=1 Tax=Dethiosulfovibrio salsuginis TaxID=561720 RepID=A0A1X7JD03_9BACT|nr:GntR family transcriptional regulator [Dethiosulfovibrio salsuginis]SMG25429.1 DNA-binding transcriptional regulator, GntR family [Dethiosulfovibrio salsuginis]